VWRKYQNFVDRTTIYPMQRWMSLLVVIFIYVLRIYATQGKNNKLDKGFIG